MCVKTNEIDLLTYLSKNEFMNDLANISKSTPIYMDSNLNDEIKGEDFAKELALIGFSELYLATGYPAETFRHLNFLKGVKGKTPPW